MASVVIVRREDGSLAGLGEVGERHYAAWRDHVKSMEVGETVAFSWQKPRSIQFHKRFFVMLGELDKRQEQFTGDQLRTWLTVGAGFADFVPGPAGRMVALPKSIAFERMDEDEFREVVDGVWQFLRSDHARRFLWPLMSDEQTALAVEDFLTAFE